MRILAKYTFGFSLVEILGVVGIVAAIAAVSIVSVKDSIQPASAVLCKGSYKP